MRAIPSSSSVLLLFTLAPPAVSVDRVYRAKGPCDIFAEASTPCVAAHSTVRSLYAAYNGPLYMLHRASDNATADIAVLSTTGFANGPAQVAFCSTPPTKCTIERIYDQSGRGNHLERVVVYEHNVHGWPTSGINAMRDELRVGNHSVFSAYFEGGQDNDPGTDSGTMGFRSNRLNGNASGTAIGDGPETVYMVTAGDHYNEGCCFDYGNSETTNCGFPGAEPCGCGAPNTPPCRKGSDDQDVVHYVGDGQDPECEGCGKMESINWSAQRPNRLDPVKGVNHVGTGSGPWILADLESGVWGGNNVGVNPTNSPINSSKFVTAVLKGRPGGWALKGGDAQSGRLKTMFDGPRPPHYSPMVKQGAIVLGIGGDNSDFGVGTFYEGALTASYTSDATDDAVQANIVAAGYGR